MMFLHCRLKFLQVKNPSDSISVGFVLYQLILGGDLERGIMYNKILNKSRLLKVLAVHNTMHILYKHIFT